MSTKGYSINKLTNMQLAKQQEKRIMPEINYNQVMAEVKSLNLSDQLRLLEQMATMIRKKTCQVEPRSIMELKGKGKDIWKELNVKTYIDKERSSWNG